MVSSSRKKRVLSALFAALAMTFANATLDNSSAAWARTHVAGSESQLGITGVQVTPNGAGLVLEANRPFTAAEMAHFSVLKFPYPYRVLLDIPNAHLTTSQTVIPINRNGIDRIELSDNVSQFYSAVRAVIYVNDNQTLSRLMPAFEGNVLKLDGAIATANASASQPLISSQTQESFHTSRGGASSRRVQPLPPLTTPQPAFGQMKIPPVPIGDRAPGPNRFQVFSQERPSVQTIMGTPLQAGTNVIESVEFREHRLYVQGNPGSELRVKTRLVLTDPSRLVLDIDNAVLASRSLLGTVAGDSDEIRQIRVGQFDEKTVRLVIETSTPELFESIFPGTDRNVLAISPYSTTSMTRLSSNTRIGEVESIDLKRENGNTVLRLSASAPIVHRFLKKDDHVTLDLLNESAHPAVINFDSQQYPEIAKMRLDPLTEGQPNSKLSISLANNNIHVVPTLSDDGRVMELMLAPGGEEDADNSGVVAPTVFGPAGKAPFAARIVLDAGHGGKDNGANRNGVYEKDLNLSMALLLRDALVAKGFKVYMTRSTDVFLPLPQITAITNQVHPDLFISIHHNASVNPALNGIETYYYTSQSIALARRVHSREINAVGARDGGVKQARFYVIHHTDVPAILCEVGYVSNPSELDALQTMDRKVKAARSIADGVVDYFKTRVSAKAR
jgi:N-acetylmuramoyl-L-alanine amidase